jgi:hypothetical protein
MKPQNILLLLLEVAPIVAFLSTPNHHRRGLPSFTRKSYRHEVQRKNTCHDMTQLFSATDKNFDDEALNTEEELRQRIRKQREVQAEIVPEMDMDVDVDMDMDTDMDELPIPDNVYIILFNPDTEREGVHTIEFPKGSGQNIILAFESEIECHIFSNSLKEQNFYAPTPQEMNLESLENYCESINVDIQIVPKGTQLKPPTENVLNLGLNPDLEKEMALLDYLYHISDSDDDETAPTPDEEEDGEFGAWE